MRRSLLGARCIAFARWPLRSAGAAQHSAQRVAVVSCSESERIMMIPDRAAEIFTGKNGPAENKKKKKLVMGALLLLLLLLLLALAPGAQAAQCFTNSSELQDAVDKLTWWTPQPPPPSPSPMDTP